MDELTIEKLVFGGQGLARDAEGRAVFVWNALPGERVRVEYLKKKKDYRQAMAVEILEPSQERVQPQDAHFLSSSPWQMLSWEAEQTWKRRLAAETYSKIGDLIIGPEDLEIVTDGTQTGYRNKMEFSFAEDDTGKIHLGLFKRGTHKRMPVADSSIATPEINETAKAMLAWVRRQRIPYRSLKSVIIRSAGKKTIAALFIKDELSFDAFPAQEGPLVGFQLYYSTHKSPASVPTKLLHSEGQAYLDESILGTTLRFGLLSFFQINPPVFELALKDMAAFLDPKAPLVDFYSGVGAIGLPLSGVRSKTILVESNQEAVDFAQHNIVTNALTGCQAHCLPSEKITEAIDGANQIILDPPRAGLHEDVVKALLKKQPERILYLSCNLSTQARDIRLLSQGYKPVFLKLYNFFPRTPHIEGLVVLEKI